MSRSSWNGDGAGDDVERTDIGVAGAESLVALPATISALRSFPT